MNPAEMAAAQPDKPAYIMAETGQVVTYAEMEAAANQTAHLFRQLGLERGDHIAILLRGTGHEPLNLLLQLWCGPFVSVNDHHPLMGSLWNGPVLLGGRVDVLVFDHAIGELPRDLHGTIRRA